jgi:hypothetical protein
MKDLHALITSSGITIKQRSKKNISPFPMTNILHYEAGRKDRCNDLRDLEIVSTAKPGTRAPWPKVGLSR